MYIVAIDDGHGLETAGKRTPTLPDGTIMKENEFNRRVAHLLAVHLIRCGIDILMVAPSDADTPLSVRTDVANKAKVDFYISIHANAFGAGGFNSVRGIETFYCPGSVKGEKAARIIHKHLIGGTKLPDRGVKTANFQVLKYTDMPAVLVECAFMTNLEDARLLLTDAYRGECGEELAKGVLEYLGSPFVEVAKPTPVVTKPEALPVIQDCVNLAVNNWMITNQKGYLINGLTYVPIRFLAEQLDALVEWDAETRTANLKRGK